MSAPNSILRISLSAMALSSVFIDSAATNAAPLLHGEWVSKGGVSIQLNQSGGKGQNLKGQMRHGKNIWQLLKGKINGDGTGKMTWISPMAKILPKFPTPIQIHIKAYATRLGYTNTQMPADVAVKLDQTTGTLLLTFSHLTAEYQRLAKKRFKFKKMIVSRKQKILFRRSFSGGFGKSTHRTGSAAGDRIDFNFNYAGKSPCPTGLALVAVFHVRNSGGKIIPNPIKAYLREEIGDQSTKDVLDGYLVDRPAKKEKSICVSTMNHQKGRRLVTGWDAPNFLKKGYTAHFEVAVICTAFQTITFFPGVLRWQNEGSNSKIVGVHTVKPSGRFKAVVRHWLKRKSGRTGKCK
jgi:hypothetical protein